MRGSNIRDYDQSGFDLSNIYYARNTGINKPSYVTAALSKVPAAGPDTSANVAFLLTTEVVAIYTLGLLFVLD